MLLGPLRHVHGRAERPHDADDSTGTWALTVASLALLLAAVALVTALRRRGS